MDKKEWNPAWMNKMLLTKLRHKKEAHRRQKQGLMILEKYREIIQAFRDCISKAKAHMELNLVRDIKGNKRASAGISAAKGR